MSTLSFITEDECVFEGFNKFDFKTNIVSTTVSEEVLTPHFESVPVLELNPLKKNCKQYKQDELYESDLFEIYKLFIPRKSQIQCLTLNNKVYKKCTKCFKLRQICEYKKTLQDNYTKVCIVCLEKRRILTIRKKKTCSNPCAHDGTMPKCSRCVKKKYQCEHRTEKYDCPLCANNKCIHNIPKSRCNQCINHMNTRFCIHLMEQKDCKECFDKFVNRKRTK